MRRARVLVVIIVLLLCCVPGYATPVVQIIGIDTFDLSDAKTETFLDNLDMVGISSPTQHMAVACFDVSDTGLVAIGFENGSDRIIDIYNENGKYLYGYQFNSDGDYTVSFQEEDIAIYFMRGDAIAVFDKDANCLDVRSVVSPHADHNKIMAIYNRTQKEVSGKTYYLDRDIGSAVRSYARLVVKDSNGTETVIYDATFDHTFRLIAMWIGIIGFSGFVLFVMIKHMLEE